MKDRIKLIIQNEGLTTTSFAKVLEIQPSAVSHLVSGRNNPSKELMCRILSKFPRYSVEWFLMGNGAVYRDQMTHLSNSNDLFNAPVSENPELEEESVVNMGFSEAQKLVSEITPPLVESRRDTDSPRPVRVMVFYDDGTCESYSLRR